MIKYVQEHVYLGVKGYMNKVVRATFRNCLNFFEANRLSSVPKQSKYDST